jgi:hypothetical protein
VLSDSRLPVTADRRSAVEAVYAALSSRGKSLAAWSRLRGHGLQATYKAVQRYAGTEARPRGLDTLLILRDLRADLAEHDPAVAALLPAVPDLRVVR